jgi:hypothetical protein
MKDKIEMGALERVRDARHQISEKFNHEPEKLVTIPRQSRGLSFMSRSKRLKGVATAAPSWEPPKGGVSVTETDLAVENVISGHCFTQPVFC